MKKSTKGALAAGTASVLLLGGAGSLAYWTANGTVTGGSINSGELKLSAGTCGDWLIDGGATFTATSKLVPGDTLTKNCTFAITASGDHLSADLSVQAPAASGALASALNVSGAFTVKGAAATKITSANNGDTLSSTVTVAFPYGTSTVSGNTTQALAATIGDYVVTATQTHA